jgi:hypothetical protein
MTAPLRNVAIDAVAVFIARAEARALLWAAGEIDLHTAVDELWADAVRDGLTAKPGIDKVQRLLADAFAPVRDDLPTSDEPPTAFADEASWREAAIEYHQDRAGRTLVVELAPERLARVRRLMADEVTFERAWHEVNERPPSDVPIATLHAAEFLLQQNDPQRFKAWLARHSEAERAAILKHLEQRKKAQAS